jgi:hypothetical protein
MSYIEFQRVLTSHGIMQIEIFEDRPLSSLRISFHQGKMSVREFLIA